jgi:hypothetical protein
MTASPGYLPVPTLTAGVDPRVALATSMQAAPGVYAVLVGSGMSSAAGIPTGWQVVEDLVRRVAAAERMPPEDLGDDPAGWWIRSGRPDLRYDTLLSALAPTDPARQALLRGYFDPPPSEGGPIRPTAGHHALASLVANGKVRLILTTNFDRLLERAMEEHGVAPQVISSAAQVIGMTPLIHAPATLIKLHGDYAMAGLRNTPEELRTYSPEWNRLLDRVVDEFGLITVGWSAAWDVALVDAILRCPSRRYPTFWTTYRGGLTNEARKIVNVRGAAVVETAGADEFLADLAERVARLDHIASRRRRPTTLRSVSFTPDLTIARRGYLGSANLLIRTVATIEPATADTCAILRADQRDALVSGLRAASVSAELRALAQASVPEGETAAATWAPTPFYQSIDFCSYRFDLRPSRFTAVATVQFPSGSTGDQIVVTLDIGAAPNPPLPLARVARLVRDGLMLVANAIPAALADTFPADATVSRAEVHLLDIDREDADRALDRKLDFKALGWRASLRWGEDGYDPEPLQHMGYAARLSGSLVERDAGGLAADALEYMAYNNGYTDPREGIDAIRGELRP